MKTYHMYHSESISAESKLKDAEKQEEKQFSKSGDLNVNLLRHDDRQPRRGFVRKIEKMKEKVGGASSEPNPSRNGGTVLAFVERAQQTAQENSPSQTANCQPLQHGANIRFHRVSKRNSIVCELNNSF